MGKSCLDDSFKHCPQRQNHCFKLPFSSHNAIHSFHDLLGTPPSWNRRPSSERLSYRENVAALRQRHHGSLQSRKNPWTNSEPLKSTQAKTEGKKTVDSVKLTTPATAPSGSPSPDRPPSNIVLGSGNTASSSLSACRRWYVCQQTYGALFWARNWQASKP